MAAPAARGVCLACGADLLVCDERTAPEDRRFGESLADAPEAELIPCAVPLGEALGGSLPSTCAVLVSGVPGAGKSSETARLVLALRRAGLRELILDSEMSAPRARDLWRRAGATPAELRRLRWCAVSTPNDVLGAIDRALPDVVLLDSLQMVAQGPTETAWLLAALCRQGAQRVVVVVSHANAKGRAHGGHAREHPSDAVVSVTPERIESTKCRWSATRSVDLPVLSANMAHMPALGLDPHQRG